MREASIHDLPGVYRVCLLTGAAGTDATDAHADPDLLGHLWAGPYLVHPEAVALVVQDAEGVAGYCVAAPDTAAFEEWAETTWLPPLRERYPAGSGASAADRAAVARLHHAPRTPAHVLATHPAHLHVDLLPRLQGQGWGRRLLEDVLARLAAAGARGVHLGVDPANVGAVAFYERLGFALMPAPPGAQLYGRVLRDDEAAPGT